MAARGSRCGNRPGSHRTVETVLTMIRIKEENKRNIQKYFGREGGGQTETETSIDKQIHATIVEFGPGSFERWQ